MDHHPISFPKRSLSTDALEVLYEDNHLISVNKPAGMLVQGDRSGEESLMDIVKEYIKERYQKPGNVFLGLVHRLDRPVSGVVLFARTSKAASRLMRQWKAHEVKKTYWAVVEGVLKPEQGKLVGHLRKSGKRVRTAKEGDPGAKEAMLEYRTLALGKRSSLVEIGLITGRKHQIRAQLSQAGCPVEGDVKYGAGEFLRDKTIRLVARSLSFRHPIAGLEMTLSVDTSDLEREFSMS
ncbi:MAG: RNA pseudouridine synthase [Deltaproteobacteria bacterium]|nr:RNA pseudouridine synthase [Deltaproteobacteria bacterium]